MLENHVLPFLTQWHVGFGLLGEQGAESIHSAYNQLSTIYANIHNGVDRLRQVTVENQTLPLLPCFVPRRPARADTPNFPTHVEVLRLHWGTIHPNLLQ